jgi:structure-specific endonuclease subunit SLX1
VRISPKTGKTRRRPQRPTVSLTDKIANLHVLLRVRSFERMPLRVQFYANDVFRVWERWSDRVHGNIRPGIDIQLEDQDVSTSATGRSLAGNDADAELEGITVLGLEALNVDYKHMKSHLEKSTQLLEHGEPIPCGVCNEALKLDETAAITCPHEGCLSVSHLRCLSQKFLADEGNINAVVPISGMCPSCKQSLKWGPLVKELTLRMRGQKEISKLFKKPRRKKADKDTQAPTSPTKSTAVGQTRTREVDNETASELDESEEDVPPSPVMQAMAEGPGHPDTGFYDIDDFSDENRTDEPNRLGNGSIGNPMTLHAKEQVEIIIDDSESEPDAIL